MPHRHPHKPVHHVKPKYKKLALIAATAALLSATSLPGMPVSTVHASANDMSASTSQQVGKTNDSSSRINLGREGNITKTPIATPKVGKEAPQKSGATKQNQNTTKTPVVSKKSTGETKEKTKTPQTIENKTKAPVATPPQTATENKEKTPLPQPSKDTSKDPITNSKPKEEKEETKSPVSDSNGPTHYKEVFDISATAYAPGPHDNGQWGTKTHIGTEVRPGIIAVDPKLIPLGSRVYIEYPDGHGEYATAEDTGGAIKGNRIDIAHQTVGEAEDFGIQNVKVYVISSPKKV